MKKISALFSLLFNVVVSVIVASVTGFSLLAVCAVVFFLQLLPSGACGLGAKIILTDFVGDIWGKVGATVYKRNFYGLSRIMKATPKNPKTVSQTDNRTSFGVLYQYFLALSNVQYLNWKTLASATPFVRKGRSYFLDVLAFFVKANRNLSLIGEAPISDCPDWSVAAQPFETFSVDVTTTPGSEDISLNISPAISTSDKIKVYATPVLGARQNSFENKYRFIGFLDNTFTSGDSIKIKYLAVFGSMPTTGQKASFAIVPVVIATGKDGMRMTSMAVGIA